MIKQLLFLTGGLLLAASVQAQQFPDWQNKDLKADSLFGISTTKAYELLKGKKSAPVIVAVVDAGVDTLHEDLKSILWINPKRKSGDNGTYGWSYIGSAKGNVQYDNLELTRQVRQFQQRDTTKLSAADLAIYHNEKKDLDKQLSDAQRSLKGISGFVAVLNAVTAKIGKTNPTLADFQAFQPTGPGETQITKTMIQVLSQKDDFAAFKAQQIDKGIEHYRASSEYQLNIAYDPRAQYVGDDYFNSKQHNYGSPDNMGPDPSHGTHVAGIIAAVRGNGIGIDGIADNVKILAVRAVPDGDERDKDIANAIRYAADHGAKVINMSFGKPYSQDKATVDEAMKYAEKKDVLIIQAAGNDDHNIDSAANFPNRKGVDGAWLVVGASGPKDGKNLKANFSNYGKTSVDVFAPGVQIYSSVPGSKYEYYSGTSMACPVVVGLAALIREYYPKLKAQQVKDIIMKSVTKVNHPVLLDKNEVPFTDLCISGGVVNAYQALTLAATY